MQDQFLISADHPVLKNHKAYGQQLLPGLAYIDMLYQIFRENGYDYKELELRNLFIHNPMIMESNYEILLNIQSNEISKGHWQIVVEGQQQRNDIKSQERIKYISAEMYQVELKVFSETLDIDKARKEANKTILLDEIYNRCRDLELIHSGLMKAEGMIFEQNTGILMDISVDRNSMSEAKDTMFHPALVDSSSVGGFGVLLFSRFEEEQKLFLPIYYESFYAEELMQKNCIARIQSSTVRWKKEVLYQTIEFFNETGKKVGELKNFANKLVREPEQIKYNSEKSIKKVQNINVEDQRISKSEKKLTNSSKEGSIAIQKAEMFLRSLLAKRFNKSSEEIDAKVGYYEMGLTSSGLIEVVKEIEDKIEKNLQPTLMFEYTTISELAVYLGENYPSKFSSAMEIDAPEEADINKFEEFQSICDIDEEIFNSKSDNNSHKVDETPAYNEDIAIIGISGRYPDAADINEYWSNLLKGKDCIKEIPKSRWDWHNYENLRSPSGKPISRWGGFIDNYDCFDPQFFRISPREAETMDPQERLFLETCWETIEDAGYTPKTLVQPRGINKRQNVGVFAGVMHKDYTLVGAEAISEENEFILTLNYAAIPNRVSYFCNFHGPSIAVDTVCSSSLTAIHLALESIKRGECEVALAGGVNLSLHPRKYLTYGLVDMHSSDGYCHTFGKGGDGYVSADGVGAVLLKPLNRAIKDGDHIYAVIKGSTINHGGTVSGITVPSPISQSELIVDCFNKTGINPRTISYIEAHGTGTSLGDPIEIQGLVKAFRQYTQEKQYCSIGSIKSNIGHAESAAGISGLQKVVLQLYHKTLVPSLHSEELNPYIDFEQSPFYIQHKTEEWKRPAIVQNGKEVTYPRRAGISSFGAFGSNAHVILEEYIPDEMQKPKETEIEGTSPEIILLSAKNKERLYLYAEKMYQHLSSFKKDSKGGYQDLKLMKDDIRRKVQKIVAEVISVYEGLLEAGQEFNEYGIEPVQVAKIKDMIEAEFKVDINELDQKSSIDSIVENLSSSFAFKEQAEQSEIDFSQKGIDLRDLAYTLQVGREAMEERIAFMVRSISELSEKLKAFIEGTEVIENCWRGSVKDGKETIQFLGLDVADLVKKWLGCRNYQKVIELWVKGYSMDWRMLCRKAKPKRISLPTYPFAKEHYWLQRSGDSTADMGKNIGVETAIHPLLHKNTSNFAEQRFTSIFTGEEFFLKDHVVKGKKVLPGVAYLEMARKAVEQAIDVIEGEQITIRLKNVFWSQPFVVDKQPSELNIRLNPDENGNISYEIFSESREEEVIHSQGIAVVYSGNENSFLNIEELQKLCNQKSIETNSCYDIFKQMGVEYGPGHRGIESIAVGNDQVLAKLSVPSSVIHSQNQYVLHPSIIDSSLQAAIGLIVASEKDIPLKPMMPFELKKIEVLAKCTPVMWAYIRYSNGRKAEDKIQIIDIDLCDDTGKICVRIKGFSSRLLEGDIQIGQVKRTMQSAGTGKIHVGNIMLAPVWDSVRLEKGQLPPTIKDKVLVIGDTETSKLIAKNYCHNAEVLVLGRNDDLCEIERKLKIYDQIDHIIWIAPDKSLAPAEKDKMIEEQNSGVLQIFRIIKVLLGMGYGSRELSWSVITMKAQYIGRNDSVNPTHASIHGLMGTTAKEYQNWKIRLVDTDTYSKRTFDDIFTLPFDKRGRAWVFRNNQWYRQQLISMQNSKVKKTAYKPGGVYVVIGGAGRIGEVWSEYMIRTYKAQIIWIGRRVKDKSIQNKLDRLSAFGPVPEYFTADAADQKSLQKAYEEIKQHYLQIDGLINSAMVLEEKSLVDMKEEEFKKALISKVNVSVCMTQVFKNETLDFVLFFSSIVSFVKNPRQGHYASGCTFVDAFAHQLSNEWPCPVKVINWGYWGGELDKSNANELLVQSYLRLAEIGIGLIEPQEAMDVLEQLLSGQSNQVGFMKTVKPLPIEGMNLEELITVYQESLTSYMSEIISSIPQQNSSIRRIEKDWALQADEMNKLLLKLLWFQLPFTEQFDGKKTVIEIMSNSGISDKYQRWIEETLQIFVRNGYLENKDGYVNAIGIPKMNQDIAWKEWYALKNNFMENRNLKAQVVLGEAMLRSLPKILTGSLLATDIMFPGASMELVEGIYKNNIVADFFNNILSDTAIEYIKKRVRDNPETKIRIIEIGAGTGGTSAGMLEKIKPFGKNIEEYCYTDVSKAFLLYAQKEFGVSNPYLVCKILNIESSLIDQGIDLGEYDIVIAANVLHATKSIIQTIRNAKAALKHNGLLLLNEISKSSLFTHLTFALLEGWWLYEDSELRISGSPGILPEKWKLILESEGFKSVDFPAEAAHSFGQQIIIAESDGVVRQRLNHDKLTVKNIPPVKAKIEPESLHREKIQKVNKADLSEYELKEKTIEYFKKLVGDTLKISSDKLDSSEQLEKYGIDSILVVQLTNALRNVFEDVSSTLFFEYQTIDELVEHFIKTSKEKLVSLLGMNDYIGKENTTSNKIFTESQTMRIVPTMRKGTKGYVRQNNSVEDKTKIWVKDVAVIGISGKYAQANNINEFWDNLLSGKNCITEVPKSRWDWQQYFNNKKGKIGSIYTKWGGFIKDIDKFDAHFFRITPREAERMDPQERLFLETTYSCIEDAGYTPNTLSDNKKVGVFVGVMNSNYPMGANYWSMANRISYLLNLQGPSMAVDTACSSSLTAIHLALESIYSGVSECAIAGGVNLIINPMHYMKLSAATMLSAGEKNRSFGEGADGFVDSEGVGAILLKPLDKAVADGDHIYGVIKGSMINAGGKTNGYTVPNPNAQYQVIADAMKRANINARTVSYIEAHGTATALGDPIEVTGLTKAFRLDTEDRQFCDIGSVKSNIGHCESAAGMAAVTKVLMQMAYGKIVPSLHSDVLNPDIDFKSTPFRLNHELKDWKRPVVDGREYPLRAGVSGFGAGGANVHIILEEYIQEDKELLHAMADDQQPLIIVLSAKNEERLKVRAKQLLEAIRKQKILSDDLLRLAYTLQVGREAMEERMAMVVVSLENLEEKLSDFINGKDNIDSLYKGHEKGNKDSLTAFSADDEMQEVIVRWIQKRKYGKLLDLWVKGLSLDWNLLYDGNKPGRVSLPTYPFAGERYWLYENVLKVGDVSDIVLSKAESVIHPMVHKNISDLYEQCFSSTFTGQEFFVINNIVNSEKILAEMACIEMGCTAVDISTKGKITESKSIRLENVMWCESIIAGNQKLLVKTGIYPKDDRSIDFEIFNELNDGSGRTVFSRGSIVMEGEEQPFLDISSVQALCNPRISAVQFYSTLSETGIEYGQGLQGIEEIYLGERQVLAKLMLPSIISDSADRYLLHPSILTSVLQAAGCLTDKLGKSIPGRLVEIKSLEFYKRFEAKMWAVIRPSEIESSGNELHMVDVDICDDKGQVYARIRGMKMNRNTLSGPQILTDASMHISTSDEPYDLMTFEETWQEENLTYESPVQAKTIVCFLSETENKQLMSEAIRKVYYNAEVIFISEGSDNKYSQNEYSIRRNELESYKEALSSIQRDFSKVDAILYLWSIESPEYDVIPIVYILQAAAAEKLNIDKLMLAGQYENQLERCYLESWIGFERSLGLVFPNMHVSVVCLENTQSDWTKVLCEELKLNRSESVVYENGKRYTSKIVQTEIQSGSSIVKAGGTYLITGGCGGLGFMFAEHLAKTKPVNLILSGRTPLDKEKQSKIKVLERLGSKVIYIAADVCNFDEMKDSINKVKESFGEINGVVHAAGIPGDRSILEKGVCDFRRILEPKINGTLILDELLEKEPLDFTCYFSSASAILGDFGTCDYSIGNRFQMAFASYRNKMLKQGKRKGKTVTINWPLWRDGGMGVGNAENTEMYLKSSGQRLLQKEEGLNIFDAILSQNITQQLVLTGQQSRVHRFLGLVNNQGIKEDVIQLSTHEKGRNREMRGLDLIQCLQLDMKKLASNLLKISKETIDIETNLADFGFDSISLTEFASILTDYFGVEITPALFFGYSTIRKISEYLLTEFANEMREFYKDEPMEQQNVSRIIKEASESCKPKINRKVRFETASPQPEARQPIAIIGMSGRFPDARNIEELWEILNKGKDVVREIPEDRQKMMGNVNAKWKCGWVPGVTEFDPLFFEISPREAKTMDPRQRLLLQETWKALEDAGYGSEHVKKNKIGMFVGVEDSGYGQMAKDEAPVTSIHNGILAARLAYFMDFSGPNMAINTACSSGLVAVHQACLSLYNGECDTAIAAGVSLMLTEDSFTVLERGGMLSPNGKCFAFDTRANGMVPGEAVAVVILKPLSKAQADGDPIYAVIKGSGINYDGKTNGITAPSGVAQTNLLKDVYSKYKINPEEIDYVITHGTGTKLGDPVEINALSSAFKTYTKKQSFCALTSTKTNIGHTFSASGIVSLISLVQALRYEKIPASLNCQDINNYISWKESPFYINRENKSWPQVQGKNRLGAVSAFGVSGTNAHVVVQDYSVQEMGTCSEQQYQLWVISAKTRQALKDKIHEIVKFLESNSFSNQDLKNIGYTLFNGRYHFNHRCAIVIYDKEDAIRLLKADESNEKLPGLFQGAVSETLSDQKAVSGFVAELVEKSKHQKPNSNEYRETLNVLADLYCQGNEIPWNCLHEVDILSRIHLPTYPFKKDLYWITLDKNKVPSNGDAVPLYSSEDEFPQYKKSGDAEKTETLEILPQTKISLQLPESFRKPSHTAVAKPSITPELLCEELADSLAEALYMNREDIDLDKKFIEMGMDSIIGVEWVRMVNKRYGTEIAATRIYDYSCIREFAAFLEKQLPHYDVKSQSIDSSEVVQSQNKVNLEPLVLQEKEVTELSDIPLPRKDPVKMQADLERSELSYEMLEKELADSLAEALYMNREDIDVDKKFIEMGMDSIIGVEWINKINKLYDTEIAATKIYDYPSIKEFAEFIRKELEAVSSPSLSDVLQNVYQGNMDIEEAYKLLNGNGK